ncbi:hypothetical protein [Pseudoalteromonas sp. SR41-4]|uniref:hypothetical protein n=1 Tax=Pseudoalteromonas sp. SR41-4 TaxID=2760950 RepID=UPI001602EE4C|nr:hypothetical protein [Pseudoalteromonas sp. SR41-4]MBB1291605.1 hypothetical protein [Pseudoalteromonas sp. SR41-4]
MKSNTTITPYGACSVIANFYGFSSVQKLFKSNQLNSLARWHSYTREHVDMLLNIEQISLDVETYRLFENVEILHYSLAHFYSKQLKVCPICFKENGLHNDGWQHTSTTICERHHTPLVNTENVLYVDSNAPAPEQTSLLFEKHILNLDRSERYVFTDALLEFASYVCRPFDFITAKLMLRDASIEYIRTLLEDTFILLCCEELFSVWESLLLKHRSNLDGMGVLVTRLGINELKAHIGSFKVLKGATTLVRAEQILMKNHSADIDTELFVSKRRFDKKPDVNELSFQVDGVMLSKFLGVHMKSISYMAMQNTLQAVYLCKQPDKSFFDIIAVQALLNRTYALANGTVKAKDKFININDVPRGMYNLFDLTPEELIDHALAGRMESQFKVGATLSYINQLLISEKGFKEVLKLKWQSQENICFGEAIKMLKANAKVINMLIEENYLALTPDKTLIDIKSMRILVSEHLILNRKANFEKSRRNEKRVTACCNVKPIKQIYMGGHFTDFVMYKREDLNSCCIRQLQSRFMHFNKQKVDLSKNVITYQTKRT